MDALNRMTKTATTSGGAQYTYRADGMRIEKVEGLTLTWVQDNPKSGHYDQNWAQNLPTTRYFYDGQMAMEEDYNNTSTYTTTRYGIGARGIDYISKYDGTNTTVGFPIYDGHGNMIATIGRTASSPYYSVDDQREYDVWGRIRAGNTTGDPKARYCANLGHVQDDESGLIYMRARYYEPWTGRFVSEDPDRHGSHWYSYAASNPVNLADRSGKTYEDIAVVAGAVLLAVLSLYFMPLATMAKYPAGLTVLISGMAFIAAWFLIDGSKCNSESIAIRAGDFTNRLLGLTAVTLTLALFVVTAGFEAVPSGGIVKNAAAAVAAYSFVLLLFLAFDAVDEEVAKVMR